MCFLLSFKLKKKHFLTFSLKVDYFLSKDEVATSNRTSKHEEYFGISQQYIQEAIQKAYTSLGLADQSQSFTSFTENGWAELYTDIILFVRNFNYPAGIELYENFKEFDQTFFTQIISTLDPAVKTELEDNMTAGGETAIIQYFDLLNQQTFAAMNGTCICNLMNFAFDF